MFSIPDMAADFSGSDQMFDMLTMDFYNVEDRPYTSFRPYRWYDGHATFFITGEGNHQVLFAAMSTDNSEPQVEYTNEKYPAEEIDQDWGVEVASNYPWKNEVWYTMRLQSWEADGKTYFGQWICDEEGAWELLAVISYEETGFGFFYPLFTLENMSPDTTKVEFRLKNAYGHKIQDKKWLHWAKYRITNSLFSNTSEDDWNYDTYCINIDNNIETGRHKDGYVWVRSGGDVFEIFDRTYPFTFKIKGEGKTPDDAKFITDGLPKDLRP